MTILIATLLSFFLPKANALTVPIVEVTKLHNQHIKLIYFANVENCQLEEDSIEAKWFNTAKKSYEELNFLEAPHLTPYMYNISSDKKSARYMIPALEKYDIPFEDMEVKLINNCQGTTYIQINENHHEVGRAHVQGQFNFFNLRFQGTVDLYDRSKTRKFQKIVIR